MSHHHEHLLEWLGKSLASTQSKSILANYSKYVEHHPVAFVGHFLAAAYCGYRVCQTYNYRNQQIKPSDYDSKLDNIAIGLNVLGFFMALNWSVSPIMPVPQIVNFVCYAFAEASYHYSMANKAHRENCKFISGDTLGDAIKRRVVGCPILNSTIGNFVSVER